MALNQAGGEFTSLDGRTTILVPPGALDSMTTFTFLPRPAPVETQNLASLRLVFAGNRFLLSAAGAAGEPVAAFDLPLTLTLRYSDADILDIPEASLALYIWSGDVSGWLDAITACPGGTYKHDLVANTLSLPLCHLTEFGLFGSWAYTFLPLVGRHAE